MISVQINGKTVAKVAKRNDANQYRPADCERSVFVGTRIINFVTKKVSR